MKMAGLGELSRAIDDQERSIKRRQTKDSRYGGKMYTTRSPSHGSRDKTKSRHPDGHMGGQAIPNHQLLTILNFVMQSLLSQQNLNGNRSTYDSDARGEERGLADLIDVLQNLDHPRAPRGGDRNALRGMPDDEVEAIADWLVRQVRDRGRDREGGHRNRSYSRNRNDYDRHDDLRDILGGMYAEHDSRSQSSTGSSSNPYRPPYYHS